MLTLWGAALPEGACVKSKYIDLCGWDKNKLWNEYSKFCDLCFVNRPRALNLLFILFATNVFSPLIYYCVDDEVIFLELKYLLYLLQKLVLKNIIRLHI